MKKYGVSVPIAGYIYKEVEANSKEEALEIVFEEGYEDEDIQEIEMYGKLIEGNICHTYYTRAEVEELDEDIE